MNHRVIIDTGPLVAVINSQDIYHKLTVDQLKLIRPPLLTCEAVISEACFLLRRHNQGVRAVFEWLYKSTIELSFHLDEETEAIQQLMAKYADVPMSLADACLVRMSERYPKHLILTLDSDFRIYRRHGKKIIKTIMPDASFTDFTESST